jgi:DNA (cytosine-5)-methyltransferase 1
MEHANDNQPGLRFLSVCSGIEAASAAWRELNWQAVAFSEIEKFPSAVLAYHYPDVPNLGDFTKINVRTLGRVDILCGGTPCQAFSVAGLRQSLADARGNLSLEFVRLAHELADGNGLRNVVWENVVGVLSTKDNAFGCFIAGLVGADAAIEPPARGKWPRHGMVSGPKGRAAWAVKDAQFFGVAQRRRRVLVVADFGNGADPAAVLFEPESVFRHPPPSREAGKDVAGATAKGFASSGDGYWREGIGPLRAREQDSHESLAVYAPEIARCDATREGSSQDYETTTMVAVGTAYSIARDALDRSGEGANGTPGERSGLGVLEEITQTIKAKGPNAVCVTGEISHALTAEGHDASEDGSGRGAPIVAFDWYASASQGMPINEFSPPLKTTMQPAVAFVQNSRDEVRLMGGATALRASQGGGDKPHVLTSAVRRLTPMECERLQGFDDNYTRIPMRSYKARRITRTRPEDMWEKIDGQWWLMAADGPRYKALGNSWAVPKFTWLGRRIAALMPLATVANDNYQSLPSARSVSHA